MFAFICNLLTNLISSFTEIRNQGWEYWFSSQLVNTELWLVLAVLPKVKLVIS